MSGADMVGHRIRETYDDLCSLDSPCVADIARTWSRRVVWPVARQLVALGLAQADSLICLNTRLEMLPWTEEFSGAQDIQYAATTVLTESRKSMVQGHEHITGVT